MSRSHCEGDKLIERCAGYTPHCIQQCGFLSQTHGPTQVYIVSGLSSERVQNQPARGFQRYVVP